MHGPRGGAPTITKRWHARTDPTPHHPCPCPYRCRRHPQLVPPENLLSAAARNFFINVLSGPLAAQPVGDVPLQPRELTPAVRDLGWRRMAMQILYIVPGDLRDPKR